MLEEWGFPFLKGGNESRIGKKGFITKTRKEVREMRYGKLFMVFVALLLIVLWSVQVNGGGKSRRFPAPIPQTGQTGIYYPGDDGDLQMGVPWPDPRFTDYGDGTVRDNLTGLIWTRSAQAFENGMLWPDALTACSGLSFAGYNDWRLPNLKEFQSLFDYGHYAPVLPATHPFTNLQFYYYWTSTTNIDPRYPNNAWSVGFYDGQILTAGHEYHFFVWCVRGGN
jgi:hypothetical protein